MAHNALWVFGYGSLIWNPGFPVAERHIARLAGYRRSFCMRSIHYRGTSDAPGLVLALDAADDADCVGVAFRVQAGAEAETLAGLRERELISSAYYEAELPVRIDGGTTHTAVCYVVDRNHVQYCGGMSLAEQARIIASAAGTRGPNTEYLFNTAKHLGELGIRDAELGWLAREVREILTVREPDS